MPDSRTVTAPTSLATSVMSASLADVDPDIAERSTSESRQRDTLEMIASENFAPRSVPQGPGSILTKARRGGCCRSWRYYGGCEYVDAIENIARDRARRSSAPNSPT